MTTWVVLLGGVLVGVLVGATTALLVIRRPRHPAGAAATAPLGVGSGGEVVPDGAVAVLSALRSSAVLVDPGDVVVQASAPAFEMGLLRGDRLVEPQLAEMVRAVRRDGAIRESELVLAGGQGAASRHVVARVAPLSERLLLVLVEDRTRERRVETVRRDFTVNVSHELKTPVGALSLLAEAVKEAADDPAAVQRFAQRMRVEAERLGRLVQQVIELSRLQDDQLLDEPSCVDVDELVAASLDRSRTDADARAVQLTGQTDTGLTVRGNAGQLEVALGNLVDNAVAYSADHTRVSVTAKAVDDVVHLTVADQGVGIAENELERIFERFYRVDPARARATGGTGLGLSIVKHVVASHGGEVRVWSVPRAGSSFTLVLPAWTDEPAADPSGPPDAVSGQNPRPALRRQGTTV